ncbi:MAG TPA: excinuclease ABC subunit UvrA [Mesotoga infera]|jgi:excinuclease ABC subunit A|nr:excinuclease ABC subunit UvrA [Mesotoga sp.]NLI05727.1 excinuclease ABC subunit UvrA [Thermotogaceae bacterium]HOI33725.1 excinuclease ABC subunit UvrA [Mesotoga infera]HON28604.1 excinuclease ABC subunit UvrA [Mesotoga infera]HPD38175.1 excinuclease ABC subunit UvrA [Mesotoga infera]
MDRYISVKGARVHNLKNVNVEIPKNSLTIITGLSGSGKSSLALDTIYAEGQRRYLESLSTYARQFLGELKRPDVESIEGLSPAIAIEQKTVSHNPRSTVGTVTEIHDHLRILYARVGVPHCPSCGRTVQRQSLDEIVEGIFKEFSEGSRIAIYSPICKEKKGEFKKELENLRKKGYVRVEIDDHIYDLEEDLKLDKNKRHTISLVIDRLKVERENASRIADSVEMALHEGNGFVEVGLIETEERKIFSENFACPVCGISLPEISPKIFSFNNPFGACPRCHGLGYTMEFSRDLVVNEDLSVLKGAFKAISGSQDSFTMKMLIRVIESLGDSPDKPFKDLREDVKNALLFGTTDDITMKYKSERLTYELKRPYEGVINNLKRRYQETQSEEMRYWMESSFMVQQTCTQCNGQRLRPEALAVTLKDRNIASISDMTIQELFDFVQEIHLSEHQFEIVGELMGEIEKRLKFLIDVGLDYITLSRYAMTLSGGESQRIRLATQIGSGLTGVTYVLDEPTIGLHSRDNDRLIKTLKNLRDLGNTVIVVEHDEEVIRNSDYIVDVGPGAGVHGGEIVYQGPTQRLIEDPPERSLTGRYLKGECSVPRLEVAGNGDRGWLTVRGASRNNLKNIDVAFPLGRFITVTGVSGSGKSSLVMDTVYPSLKNRLGNSKTPIDTGASLEGWEAIDSVIVIDQSPIGRTPRSNPATYTGLFDFVRDLFAKTQEARARGYSKGRFSFNVKGGRCEACQGHGMIKIEMQFLPDVYVECDVCKGRRYNKETMEIKYRGRSISDVLNMTVEEASYFFERIPVLNRILELLNDVGLGYIRLGQPATTLSGGEAQRIKLASELKKKSTGSTFYILDEPTTGLHFDDVSKLVKVLKRLVELGNTVVVVEHNMDVIKNADYIIDLGPEGGARGGEVVISGTPEEVAETRFSHTGYYLRKLLNPVR